MSEGKRYFKNAAKIIIGVLALIIFLVGEWYILHGGEMGAPTTISAQL